MSKQKQHHVQTKHACDIVNIATSSIHLGLPENVDAARKEIEAHIALRTGGETSSSNSSTGAGGSTNIGNIYGIGEHPLNHLHHQQDVSSSCDRFGGFSASLDQLSSSRGSGGGGKFNSILGSNELDFDKGVTLHSLLESGGGNEHNFHHGPLVPSRSSGPSLTAWSNGGDNLDHHRRSPPFENNGVDVNGTAIWGELNKVLGGLDLNGDRASLHQQQLNPLLFDSGNDLLHKSASSPFFNVGSRSSLDLGSLGRPQISPGNNESSNRVSTAAIARPTTTAAVNRHHNSVLAASAGNSLDLGSSSAGSCASSNPTATPPGGGLAMLDSSSSSSPPSSLPFVSTNSSALAANQQHVLLGPLTLHHRASVSSEPGGFSVGGFEERDVARHGQAAFAALTAAINKSETNMGNKEKVSTEGISNDTVDNSAQERGNGGGEKDFLSFAN